MADNPTLASLYVEHTEIHEKKERVKKNQSLDLENDTEKHKSTPKNESLKQEDTKVWKREIRSEKSLNEVNKGIYTLVLVAKRPNNPNV